MEIENLSYNEILKTIEDKINRESTFTFSYVNVYVALLARDNLMLRQDLNCFSILLPDGIGMYWASKFLYNKKGFSERISATDLHYKILNLAQQKKYRVFFFGGGEETARVLNQNIKKMYPNLLITGVIQRDLSYDEDIVNKLKASKSNILFLGLGTPYQEKWIATFGKKANITVQWSVGSGIDFLAGVYKRAPILLQKIGLEWLFRLHLEPKRLWKRYLVGIPTFIILIIKQKLFNNKKQI